MLQTFTLHMLSTFTSTLLHSTGTINPFRMFRSSLIRISYPRCTSTVLAGFLVFSSLRAWCRMKKIFASFLLCSLKKTFPKAKLITMVWIMVLRDILFHHLICPQSLIDSIKKNSLITGSWRHQFSGQIWSLSEKISHRFLPSRETNYYKI